MRGGEACAAGEARGAAVYRPVPDGGTVTRAIATRPGAGASPALEAGVPAAQERLDALAEVLGRGELLLEARLERQLLAQPPVHPGVELALARGVGPRRPGRQALGE